MGYDKGFNKSSYNNWDNNSNKNGNNNEGYNNNNHNNNKKFAPSQNNKSDKNEGNTNNVSSFFDPSATSAANLFLYKVNGAVDLKAFDVMDENEQTTTWLCILTPLQIYPIFSLPSTRLKVYCTIFYST